MTKKHKKVEVGAMKRVTLGVCMLVAVLCGCATTEWKTTLDRELPVYGHRNWIVVADAAYPKQSAPGIETIYTGQGQLEVLKHVLGSIEGAPHVRATVLMDAELESVPEADAPGVDAYRTLLKELLQGRQVEVMPHEEIIGKLDQGAKLFNVLLLKTDMTIPYTSVFLELDCGYWNAEKEARLRQALQEKEGGK